MTTFPSCRGRVTVARSRLVLGTHVLRVVCQWVLLAVTLFACRAGSRGPVDVCPKEIERDASVKRLSTAAAASAAAGVPRGASASVVITVVDGSARPIAGARVRISSDLTVLTGWDGVAHVQRAPVGEYRAAIWSQGHRAQAVPLEVIPGRSVSARVVLRACRGLRSVVLDAESARPVADAELRLYDDGDWGAPWPESVPAHVGRPTWQARSDGRGEITLPCSWGALEIRARGYATIWKFYDATKSSMRRRFPVYLPQSGCVRGHVVAGLESRCSVVATPRELALHVYPDEGYSDPFLWRTPVFRDALRVRTVSVQQGGGFFIEGEPIGEVLVLRVMCSGHEPGTAVVVRAALGKRSPDVSLRPGPLFLQGRPDGDRNRDATTSAFEVAGQVVDEAGRPVAGAGVWIHGRRGAAALTDAGGHFAGIRGALEPLTEIVAAKAGYSRATRDLRTSGNARVVLTLERAARLVGEARIPMTVTEPGSLGLSWQLGWGEAVVPWPAHARGRLRFDISAPPGHLGDLRIEAWPFAAEVRQVETVPGQTLDLGTVQLAPIPHEVISGTVRREEGGALPDAEVTFKRDEEVGTAAQATTDEAGAFQFNVRGQVLGGELRVVRAGYCNVVRHIVAGPGPKRVDIAMEEAGTIEGRVLGAEGHPVFLLQIEAWSAASKETWGALTYTDRGGRYYLELKPGLWSLRWALPGHQHVGRGDERIIRDRFRVGAGEHLSLVTYLSDLPQVGVPKPRERSR